MSVPAKIASERLTNFEKAFSDHASGCLLQCNCGRVFYDTVNNYDWEEGELERLDADSNATGLPHSCGHIGFEGRRYCDGCNCWHDRALKIMEFLDAHDVQIAEWFKLERGRKKSEFEESPEISLPSHA